jgi:hypothetical protein
LLQSLVTEDHRKLFFVVERAQRILIKQMKVVPLVNRRKDKGAAHRAGRAGDP